ncbi:MAG: TonB-dependent receptor plug domain-containing protein, partial [Duncaniella sp.]|nr:TonB-dependent receptor plug domain-containing protein [Duncaniella sp.]
SAGVNVRRQGGMGADLDLSINVLSCSSVRYFIDGIPLDSRGGEVNLDNIPLNSVDRVELYKGVVPAHLGSDALGGAVNIITKRHRKSYLDAAYGFGSFNTHTADISGQFAIPGSAIVVRPTFGLNYSKNNYLMRGVEVWSDEQDKYITTNRHRYHDSFFSLTAGLEAGVTDAPWADRFFISGTFTKIDKEIQTGAMQNKVYGLPERHSDAWCASVQYLKRWNNLNTRLTVSHTWDYSETVDTAYRKYSWNGTWIPANGNEMTGKAKTIRTYRRPLTLLNAGADYTIARTHTLSLNYLLNRRGNRRADEVDATFEPTNDVITKQIIALTYSASFFDDRLSAMAFGKEYVNTATIRQTDNFTVTGADLISSHATRHYEGGGAGLRFTICPIVAAKASYEHSVRLPLSRELLGNGTTVLPNVALRPESSNNLNIGLFGSWSVTHSHCISYEINAFLRHVQNYIRATVSERDGMMQYVNQPAVAV